LKIDVKSILKSRIDAKSIFNVRIDFKSILKTILNLGGYLSINFTKFVQN